MASSPFETIEPVPAADAPGFGDEDPIAGLRSGSRLSFLMAAGRYDEALPGYVRLLGSASRDPRTLHLRGRLHEKIGTCLFGLDKWHLAAQHFQRDHELTLDCARAAGVLDRDMCLVRTTSLSRRIGEVTKRLDVFAKAVDLGHLPGRRRVVVLARDHPVYHAELYRYWSPHYVFVSAPDAAWRLPAFAGAEFSAHHVPIGDGRVHVCDYAWHALQREWEDRGLAPLMRPSEADEADGRRALRALGMPDDAWFVTLHVRHGGYFTDWQNVRCADIADYLPAVEAVTRRGGWVMRLGDHTMPPMPEMARVVDCTRAPHDGFAFHLFLIANSRFMISSASGPCALANACGTPQAQTNVFPFVDRPWSRRDLFMPMTMGDAETGSPVPFARLVSPLMMSDRERDLRAAGLRARHNSSEEIRELVEEMLDLCDGRDPETPAVRSLRERFDALFAGRLPAMNSRVGSGFIGRHASLLDDAV